MPVTVRKEELIKCRIMAGYSQRGLAKAAGISGAYLSQLESGDRNPSPKTAKKIAETLGVGFSDLFFVNSACKSEQVEKVSKSTA